MDKPSYLTWIIKENGVVLDNGEPINCFKIDCSADDEIIDAWAVHIRRHYISDEELSESCAVLDMTPEEYLKEKVIPQKGEERLSGSARSNGISEILFMDLLEFVYDFEVPRCRMDNMSGKTVSEHGTDVIGYRFFNRDRTADENDILVTMEVKAGLTQGTTEVIEKAVIDACKDEFRLAQSLDYMRKKLKRMNQIDKVQDIIRFLKKTRKDFKLESYAAGISSLEEIPEKTVDGVIVKVIPEIDGDELRLKGNSAIYYVHGRQLMDLTHKIYNRCIK